MPCHCQLPGRQYSESPLNLPLATINGLLRYSLFNALMSSQFLYFPDDLPHGKAEDVEHENDGLLGIFTQTFNGIRKRVGEMARPTPVPRSCSRTPSLASDSTDSISSQEDSMPLVIAIDRAVSTSTCSAELLQPVRHHRRAKSHDPTCQPDYHQEPLLLLPPPNTITTAAVFSSDMQQPDSRLQRRGAQRKNAPPPLRLRPCASNQSLEILQPSPRSCHSVVRFLAEEGYSNNGSFIP